MLMPSVVGVGQGDIRDIGDQHGGDRGACLGHPLEHLVEVVGVGPSGRQLVGRDLVHGRGGLGRQGPDGPGVEVDPRLERRQRRPDRGKAVRVGGERGDHGRMIPTMSGLARPELLATTEWLAEHLGRPEVRVLDARWRPDGTGPQVHARGHIPGAVYVDWRADLVDTHDEADALRLAAPDRVAAVAARAGIGDGSTVVVYDDTQSLYAARVWWTLRTYGLEGVRVLDGGFPTWEAEGRAVAHLIVEPPAPPSGVPFVPRGPNRMNLTTADVRGLLGAPDVTLLDARAPAEYRGFEGNTRRLGHIPGAVNVAVGIDEPAGQPGPAQRRGATGPTARRERQPGPPDGGLRRIGCRRREAGLRADAPGP